MLFALLIRPKLKETLGTEFAAAYLKMKSAEWASFASHFSTWEKTQSIFDAYLIRGFIQWHFLVPRFGSLLFDESLNWDNTGIFGYSF